MTNAHFKRYRMLPAKMQYAKIAETYTILERKTDI
jgi:hypothetical protein